MLNTELTGEPEPHRLQRILNWLWHNKIKSLFGVLLLWMFFEVLFLPFGEISRLKSANPIETAFMRHHEERAREEGKPFTKRQRWIPLSRLPKHLLNAVLVSEDGTFWSHDGFDWFEFRESFERNLRDGKFTRGASTITQQLVKNLFLSPSKNPLRKVKEWILTWRVEQVLSKSRILELYMNVIEWGDGIYGAEAASQYYFGISATLISRTEAARLAAVIPNPRRYRPNGTSRYIARRAELILGRMSARGL